jgi:hypothetical protein
VDAAYNNKEDYNSLLASTFYVPTVALNGLYLDTPAVDNLINFVTDSEGKLVTFTMPAEKLSAATRFSLGVTIDSPDLTVTRVDANQAYVNLSIHLCNNSINTKKCVDADVFQSAVVQNVTFLTACDAKLNAVHSTSTEYCSSCQEIDQCDYVLGENAFYCAHQAATTFPRLEECESVPTDNNKDIWVYVAVGSSVVVVMVLAYMGYRYKQSQTEAEQDGSLNYDALGA